MVRKLCHCSEDQLIYTCTGTGMMLTASFNIVMKYLPFLGLIESCRKALLGSENHVTLIFS